MPSAAEVLAHSELCGVDVRRVLAEFHPNVASAVATGTSAPELAAWLSALRGSQRLASVAQEAGMSRYSVGRFLAGQAQPRLPQFLALVEALTHRVEELVDGWVGIEHVPSLEPRFQRAKAAREAMLQRPVCLAVLCLLDTRPLRAAPLSKQLTELARVLERPAAEMEQCLELLAEGGVIGLSGGGYLPSASLTVDSRASKERESAVKGYWASVAQARAERAGPMDVCSYNVFSIAKEDYAKLKQLQREFYRGARALIATSEPTDMAGLLMVQLVAWAPQEEPRSELSPA
jgi:DNA-binding phage protein